MATGNGVAAGVRVVPGGEVAVGAEVAAGSGVATSAVAGVGVKVAGGSGSCGVAGTGVSVVFFSRAPTAYRLKLLRLAINRPAGAGEGS